MTFYCNRCKIVFESDENKCRCGKKKLQAPQENDIVYVTTRANGPLSGMFEDMLTNNDILFMRRESQGSIPMAAFGFAFYFDYLVHYKNLDKAKELDKLTPEQSAILPVLPI